MMMGTLCIKIFGKKPFRLPKNEQLDEKQSFDGNCEILRTIFIIRYTNKARKEMLSILSVL